MLEIDVKTAIKVKIKAKSTTLKSKISAQNHHNVHLFGHKNGNFQKILRIQQSKWQQSKFDNENSTLKMATMKMATMKMATMKILTMKMQQ